MNSEKGFNNPTITSLAEILGSSDQDCSEEVLFENVTKLAKACGLSTELTQAILSSRKSRLASAHTEKTSLFPTNIQFIQ